MRRLRFVDILQGTVTFGRWRRPEVEQEQKSELMGSSEHHDERTRDLHIDDIWDDE